jgi:GAF domain-containing protein
VHELNDVRSLPKAELYAELEGSLRSLLAGETNLVAAAANMSSLLYWSLPDLNWAGFYLVDAGSGDLLVGPFQGKPACVRIPLGKGVCGTAAAERRTVLVEDVHEFPGHIACDSASNSEIVVPVIAAGRLVGVLDLDSPVPGRFDAADAKGLERLVEVFVAATRASD